MSYTYTDFDCVKYSVMNISLAPILDFKFYSFLSKMTIFEEIFILMLPILRKTEWLFRYSLSAEKNLFGKIS